MVDVGGGTTDLTLIHARFEDGRPVLNRIAVGDHLMLGGDKPTDIPVRLLYDDQSLNMPTRYACYKGKALWCSGDGEQAMRLDEQAKEYRPCSCPCPRKEPTYDGNDPCKMNGNLSVMVDGAGGLGEGFQGRQLGHVAPQVHRQHGAQLAAVQAGQGVGQGFRRHQAGLRVHIAVLEHGLS